MTPIHDEAVEAALDGYGRSYATGYSGLRMRAALEAALPHLVPDKGEVGVKALEWKREGDVCWRAHTIIGRYTMVQEIPARTVELPAQWWGPEPTDDIHNASSDDTAKAAAQADYEARIRSALYLKPLPPERGSEDRVAHLERANDSLAANFEKMLARAETAEAELHRLKSADHSTGNMVVDDAIETLRFNATNLIAEEELGDALHILACARDVMRDVADKLEGGK